VCVCVSCFFGCFCVFGLKREVLPSKLLVLALLLGCGCIGFQIVKDLVAEEKELVCTASPYFDSEGHVFFFFFLQAAARLLHKDVTALCCWNLASSTSFQLKLFHSRGFIISLLLFHPFWASSTSIHAY
jgi:hypothetical protein